MNSFTKFILLGPRNVGKTNMGLRLSSFIDIPCIDMDDIIRDQYGSVNQIVGKDGWKRFREIENLILRDLLINYSNKNLILILGGGTISHKYELLRNANIELINNFHPSEKVLILPYEEVAINAKILSSRMQTRSDNWHSKPPLTKLTPVEEMLYILESRKEFYENFATYTLYTYELNEEEVTLKFINIFRSTHLAGHLHIVDNNPDIPPTF